ncbi:glutathione peroxidase [Paenibacillus sp. HB172176]|uniref:glutathione peroxidase n=1 Tax=Paenibacillus sp. HB172176 TaxID=2493690 RepID=UPI00143AD9CF|nr:glutathione peroxidase [Paenibacillus sp. HB172176]
MSIYDFKLRAISGKLIDMSIYRGKVLLIVNTASQCAYSRQFADLQGLYESLREQGFEILAFPCNQFNGKEPGSNAEIQGYCETSFGLTFPMLEKVEVRGAHAHPLFAYLTEQSPFRGFDMETSGGRWMDDFLREKHPDIYRGDGIKWNFTKFLINRDGAVRGRYEPSLEPGDINPDIEALLAN